MTAEIGQLSAREYLALTRAAARGQKNAFLDRAVTAMGGRLLRRWLLHPLVEAGEIWRRQEAVEECVELTSADIDRFHGRRVLPVREQLVPYVRLRDFFEMGGRRPEREQMVVVRE